MEHISTVTGVVCVSVFAVSVLYSFGCFSATEKVVKFVISLYLLTVFIKSITDTRFEFKTNFNGLTAYSGSYTIDFTDIVLEETETNLEQTIKQRLDEKNISYKQISVHILEENEYLTADKIIVQCSEKDVGAVRECIKDMISDNTQVITGE